MTLAPAVSTVKTQFGMMSRICIGSLHTLSTRALDTSKKQQHAGSNHERDSASSEHRERVRCMSKRPDAGCGPSALHRAQEVDYAVLRGHGPTR